MIDLIKRKEIKGNVRTFATEAATAAKYREQTGRGKGKRSGEDCNCVPWWYNYVCYGAIRRAEKIFL